MSINSHFVETAVTVSTHARLHLGFFNLSNSACRKFGGWGVAIDAFKTSVRLSHVPNTKATDAWIHRHLQTQLSGLNLSENTDLQVDVIEQIPRHCGLGSGTQMALAVGAALQTYEHLPINVQAIARHAGRGRRSGIGIATFQQGGLIVDGGVSANSVIPPVLSRINFPDEWCFVLVVDHAYSGLHGEQEKQAFVVLQPASLVETEKLSHLCLMQGIPAVIEQNFDDFSVVLGAVQDYNAKYFSPSQGGDYASQRVGEVMQHVKTLGYSGVGQSSWGPTGFILLPSRLAAIALIKSLRSMFLSSNLDFLITHAINHGHCVHFD